MSNKCAFPGCDKPVFVKKTSYDNGNGETGLCNGHYKQYKQLLRANQPLTKMHPLRKYEPKKKTLVDRECKFDGCDRPVWGKYDYCQSHQRQYWENNEDPTKLTPIRSYNFHLNSECKYTDPKTGQKCSRPIKAQGLCSKHYSKWRNNLKKLKKDIKEIDKDEQTTKE